jgi:acetolactate synthase-1/3 small subunit
MANDHKPRQFIFGMYVNDEPGVLNRISGMFSRRGVNIDTVTVGSTSNPHVSKIIVSFTETPKTAVQMEKQLRKIIAVRRIQHLDKEYSIIREFCLIKVSTNKGKNSEAIKKIANDYEGKIIDVNKDEVILEFGASPEVVLDIIRKIESYGIKKWSSM